MAKEVAERLRANPLYELVLYDRLSAEDRRALSDLAKAPGFYGIFRPPEGSGLGVKAVDRDTALLFLTLREPGPLPEYVRASLGEAAARTVARWVADGVLEVELDGAFVSGAAAGGKDAKDTRDSKDSGGLLAELSRAALKYGQDLAVDDPTLLSWRLYSYNRMPLTPRWKRLLPSPEAVAKYLGIAAGGSSRKLLDSRWLAAGSAAWLSWRARRAESSGSGGPTWKLYVSPSPEALAESFGALLDAFAAGRADHFKVGKDAAGLLRPDKIVAYFPSFERLAHAAEVVQRRLDGVAVQGVPFTSEIGAGGLVSWGVDPAKDAWDLGGSESWRLWLTRRLARALVSARTTEGVEPWRFAVERLRLEGVNTDSWTPGALTLRER